MVAYTGASKTQASRTGRWADNQLHMAAFSQRMGCLACLGSVRRPLDTRHKLGYLGVRDRQRYRGRCFVGIHGIYCIKKYVCRSHHLDPR